MRTIQKVLTLPKAKYYETHLSLVNALLPIKMTPKEIEVVAIFMSLEGDIALDRFGTSGRKIVKTQLNISDGGLGNYMKSLKDKKFFVTQGNQLYFHPILQADPTEQVYQFKLINNGHIQDTSSRPSE